MYRVRMSTFGNKQEITISEYAQLIDYLRTFRGTYAVGALLSVRSQRLCPADPLAAEAGGGESAVSRYAAPITARISASSSWRSAVDPWVIVRIFSRTTLLHAGRRIEYRIREDLYKSLLSLDLPYFSRERTGDLLSRFSNDLTNVRMLLGFGILNVINTIIVYVSAIVLMGSINLFLTICAVLPYPLMILLVKQVSRRIFYHSKRAQEELAALTSHAEESIAAAVVVKAYCREAFQIAAFRRLAEHYLGSSMKMANLRGIVIPFMASMEASAP
jgi:ATP-binding cassette, subfamily B, multidrug efflux pump